MHHFHYKRGALAAEEVPISEIIRQAGTPCYIYSQATLEHHFKVFDQAFSKIPHLTCYAQKANSNLALLRLFRPAGGRDRYRVRRRAISGLEGRDSSGADRLLRGGEDRRKKSVMP